MINDYTKQMKKLKLKQEIRNNELKKFLYTLKATPLTERKIVIVNFNETLYPYGIEVMKSVVESILGTNKNVEVFTSLEQLQGNVGDKVFLVEAHNHSLLQSAYEEIDEENSNPVFIVPIFMEQKYVSYNTTPPAYLEEVEEVDMDTRDITVMRSKSSFFMDLTGKLKRNELRAPWLNKMLTEITTSSLLFDEEKEVLTSAIPINHVLSNAIVKGFID